MRGYVRYSDDFALFAADRGALRDAAGELRRWLPDELGLDLNERAARTYACMSGWPFLGFRVLPRGLEIRRVTWRRIRQRWLGTERAFARGAITIDDLTRSNGSRLAHLERGRTRTLRRKELLDVCIGD